MAGKGLAILVWQSSEVWAVLMYESGGAGMAAAPRVLGVRRGGQDATELVSRLASQHYAAQTRPEKRHFCRQGLDLVEGSVRDSVAAGVLEPVLSKVKIVQVPPPPCCHCPALVSGGWIPARRAAVVGCAVHANAGWWGSARHPQHRSGVPLAVCRQRAPSSVHAAFAAQFATEAAITVLRIDDMIKLEKGEDETD